MKEYEKILKALANKRRLEILKHLKDKKVGTVGELAGKIKLSFKSTSKHLAVLSGSDIVDKEQRGVAMYYRLNSKQRPLAKSVIGLL